MMESMRAYLSSRPPTPPLTALAPFWKGESTALRICSGALASGPLAPAQAMMPPSSTARATRALNFPVLKKSFSGLTSPVLPGQPRQIGVALPSCVQIFG